MAPAKRKRADFSASLPEQEVSAQPRLNLKFRFNNDFCLFLDQSIMSKYCGLVKKMVEQEIGKGKSKNVEINMNGFPGGVTGFELAARFCYNNGRCQLTPANLPLLHSAAVFLKMDEEVAKCNLHHQAETFLDGLFNWTWSDLLGAVAACEPIFAAANCSGLLHKLLSSLVTNIAAFTPDASSSSAYSVSSTSSSSECSTGGSSKVVTPARKEWWFDDLTKLSPRMLEQMFKIMGSFGKENNNLILTRFLLQYLKVVANRSQAGRIDCVRLGETAFHGLVAMGWPQEAARLRVFHACSVAEERTDESFLTASTDFSDEDTVPLLASDVEFPPLPRAAESHIIDMRALELEQMNSKKDIPLFKQIWPTWLPALQSETWTELTLVICVHFVFLFLSELGVFFLLRLIETKFETGHHHIAVLALLAAAVGVAVKLSVDKAMGSILHWLRRIGRKFM